MKALRIALAMAGLLSSATLMAAPTTAQRLDVLERRVSRVTELTLQMDELRSENRQLRGEIENLGYEIEQLKRKQRDIYLDIDQRLSGGQGAGTPPAEEPAATPEAGQTRPQLRLRTVHRRQLSPPATGPRSRPSTRRPMTC